MDLTIHEKKFYLVNTKVYWGYSQSTVNFCKLETITIRWISSFRTTDPIKNLTYIFLIYLQLIHVKIPPARMKENVKATVVHLVVNARKDLQEKPVK